MWFKEISETRNITAEITGVLVDLYATYITYTEMCRWNFEVTASFSWLNHNDGKWPEVQTTAEWVSIKMRWSAINTDYLFDETSARIVQLVKQVTCALYDLCIQSWQEQGTFLQNIQIGTGVYSLLFSGYQSSFLAVKLPVVKLTTHLHLMLRLRMNGATPLFHSICKHSSLDRDNITVFTCT
jgi:hypothetical protein